MSSPRLRTRRTATGFVGLGLAAVLVVACAGSPAPTPAAPTAGPPAAGSTSAPPAAESLLPNTSAAKSSTPSGPPVAQALTSDTPRGKAAAPAVAGTSMTDFGVAFFDETLAQLTAGDSPVANSVLSPYSLYAVLAMARAGAKGDTGTQIDTLLGADQQTQAEVMTAIDKAIAHALDDGTTIPPRKKEPKSGDDRPFAFDTANSLWQQPGLEVHQEFLDALAAGYGAAAYDLDFGSDPEAARKVVNDWVSEHTGELIPELLKYLDPLTVLALVNAVHLQAPWAESLDPAGDGPFATTTGPVTAPMMSKVGQYRYLQGAGWSSVEIPYRGNGMAMSIILPDKGNEAAVAEDLTGVIGQAVAGGKNTDVQLTLPTFTITTETPAKSVAQALGVTDIFGGAADLSGIAGDPGDYVADQFVHQAVIEVDENGTEAAAATAMTMVRVCACPPRYDVEFTVDRPFYFVIHDTTTDAALFLGRVTDPTA